MIEEHEKQPKTRKRRWRYVFMLIAVMFCFYLGNSYYSSQKKEEFIRLLESNDGCVNRSAMRTGFGWVDGYLRRLGNTKHVGRYIQKSYLMSIQPGTFDHEFMPEIKKFPSLQYLSVPGNQVSDLTSLKGLTKMKRLSLYDNEIVDLTPLAGMKELEWLSIYKNQIEDLTPLEGMIKLKDLIIHGNQITDLAAIRGLKDLKRLQISSNKIKDLKPLSGLKNLKSLTISDNLITDLNPLKEMSNLRRVTIGASAGINHEKVEDLKKALPKCLINYYPIK